MDGDDVHLLGRQGKLLGRWRWHGAGGFRCDVAESRGFNFCRLLLLCALRALHAPCWRRQGAGAFPRSGGSLSYWCTFGTNGVLVQREKTTGGGYAFVKLQIWSFTSNMASEMWENPCFHATVDWISVGKHVSLKKCHCFSQHSNILSIFYYLMIKIKNPCQDFTLNVTFVFMLVDFIPYLWLSGVSRGGVRQRLKWGRRCHASAFSTLFFISLRSADPVVGRGRSAAAGWQLALRRGLLHLLERFLYNCGSTRQLWQTVGRGCPVGQSGLWLSAHTVPGNGQTQTTVHRLDLAQLGWLKFLSRKRGLFLHFLSRMLKARKFNTYIYYFTKSQIFLIPFSPVGKREARSSWTSLSVPMVPYSSRNTTSPAWWSAHLHFSWFQVSFNTQTQTLVCWTAHPGGTDIFFDLLHHSLPSHLK